MSSSNCCFLTCIQVSQEEGKVVWHSYHLKNFPQFVVIHTVKGFSIVNEAEVDIFLEFPWFFYDPMDVGNLISGSSAFSKSSLYIWKFSVHVMLKPGLKDFEHYLASMWDECNCAVVSTFFGIALLGIGMKTEVFQSCGHCWVFQICWQLLPGKSYGWRSLGVLQSIGLHRVGHDWSNSAAAAAGYDYIDMRYELIQR